MLCGVRFRGEMLVCSWGEDLLRLESSSWPTSVPLLFKHSTQPGPPEKSLFSSVPATEFRTPSART